MYYCYRILLLFVLCCKGVPIKAEDCSPVVSRYAAARDEAALPAKVVAFAKTLIGTPYSFGCTAPALGFDCSGFINYVFGHFNMDVPRSSEGFTNEGTDIALKLALPGDLILFTGTNNTVKKVGHIGLVVAHDTAGISFIHSSSGKEHAVIITQLDERYMARFVKVIRIM